MGGPDHDHRTPACEPHIAHMGAAALPAPVCIYILKYPPCAAAQWNGNGWKSPPGTFILGYWLSISCISAAVISLLTHAQVYLYVYRSGWELPRVNTRQGCGGDAADATALPGMDQPSPWWEVWEDAHRFETATGAISNVSIVTGWWRWQGYRSCVVYESIYILGYCMEGFLRKDRRIWVLIEK